MGELGIMVETAASRFQMESSGKVKRSPPNKQNNNKTTTTTTTIDCWELPIGIKFTRKISAL